MNAGFRLGTQPGQSPTTARLDASRSILDFGHSEGGGRFGEAVVRRIPRRRTITPAACRTLSTAARNDITREEEREKERREKRVKDGDRLELSSVSYYLSDVGPLEVSPVGEPCWARRLFLQDPLRKPAPSGEHDGRRRESSSV
ncbi:hypothetical protein K0M31_017441 [Melipona bicolor]|uniref:Uncharacterized protein n=1 Tax=Melipona bicolor TaxID=60889 RepID=A0AA40G5L6_9HYME|nr:hypothetical protein K0M31_017441 [Melipona bicolor]